jgi:predicted  nucleic acid-binding Zn-ribbon protein
MTFDKAEQDRHRKVFIDESRSKAWGAACNADFIAASLDKVTADYQKLKDEDTKLEAEIKTLELAIDSHTKDNRDKRKAIQGRRNSIAKVMQALQVNMKQGQAAMQNLYVSVETNLALAKHAETWEWKEAVAAQHVEPVHDQTHATVA